jgi:hypothetical protein
MISPAERARLRSQRRWRERRRRAQEALARVKRHEVLLGALQRLAASEASAEARRAWARSRMIFATPYASEEVAVYAEGDPWSKPKLPVIARVLWHVLGQRKSVELIAAIQLFAAQEKERTRAAQPRRW